VSADEAGQPSYAELLQQRIRQARGQRDSLLDAIADVRLARSLTFADDEHDPEGSTLSLDQARDAALLARAQQSLAELTAAEERLADGSYGVCERCGGPIPAERLRARPEARWCVPCSG
jgi:RNA polymerase-binding transcription factor DksA